MCALAQSKNVLRVLVLNHVVVLAQPLYWSQLSILLDKFASPGTVFVMDSKTDIISGYIASWKPNASGVSDDDITQLRTLVAEVPPVSCRDAGSMLAAGLRFLSDQSATGEKVAWSIDSVDGWCSRAVAGGMAESTMTRYRSWLRRITRVAQGLPGRSVDRSQSVHYREGVSDVDLELLIELASGSQWLWWVVVTFGAGVTGSEAVTAAVSNGHVVVGKTRRPIVGPFAGLDVETKCPDSTWVGFRRWCERNGINISVGDVADTYTDLVVLSDIPAVTTLQLFGHNRLRNATKRCGIAVTESGILADLR